MLTEHEFELPLDHGQPDDARISVFAREVAAVDGGDRPFLVFLQGGPGYESPRPTRRPNDPGWVDRALADYRVLLLDQRGTGRSTPVGSLPGMTATEQAEYLSHFRADSIVRDAEAIRQALGVDRWSVLGQSFGGFCALSYLSLAPEGLREAFITGGVPPLGSRIDEVYEATYRRVIDRSRRYYRRYPADEARMRALAELLAVEDVRLPSGDRLTHRRVRQLGNLLGMSDGPEQLHAVLEQPFDSPGFLHDVELNTPFARNPLYALLNEASWADGGSTRWSAERMLPGDYDDAPALFTGEHMYPWMLEDHRALHPLREAAHRLAERTWPRLYDEDRLAANEVPVAAAVYANDLYVERRFSEETAAHVGAFRLWLTSEYEHNGLRADGARLLDRLIELARDPA